MSLVAAAVAAARQQKPRLPAIARQSELWLSANSLNPSSQFWYDEAQYHSFNGEPYLWQPGAINGHVSLPDSAAMHMTGDLDVRAKIAPTSWTPSRIMSIVSRMDNSDAANRHFRFRLETNGCLLLVVSIDGNVSNQFVRFSTVPVVASAGTALWVRATLDVDNSNGGHTITFYTSTDGTTWNVLGTPVITPGATQTASVAQALHVGGFPSSTEGLEGRIYRAQLRNGINGTVVADFNAATYLENGWSLADQVMTGSYSVIVDNSRTPKYRARLGASSLLDAQTPKILTVNEPAHIFFNGALQYYYRPHATVNLNLANDFDVQFKIAPSDWANSDSLGIVGQWTATGDHRSWGIDLLNGRIVVYVSSDGTAAGITSRSSVIINTSMGVLNGEWLECKLQFRYVESNVMVTILGRVPGEASWLKLGSDSIGPGIFQSTASLYAGARYGNYTFIGKLASLSITQHNETKVTFGPAAGDGWTKVGDSKVVASNQDPYAFGPGTTGNAVWSATSPGSISYDNNISVRVDAKSSWHKLGAVYRFHTAAYVYVDNSGTLYFQKWDDTAYTDSTSHSARFAIPTFLRNQRIQLRLDWTHGSQPVAYYSVCNTTQELLTADDNWTSLVRTYDLQNHTPTKPIEAKQRSSVMSNFNYGSYFDGRVYRVEVAFDGVFTNNTNIRFDARTALASGWYELYTTTGYQAHIITRNTIMFDGVDDYAVYTKRDGVQPLNSDVTYGILASLTEQNASHYPRIFSMEEDNGSFPAIASYYLGNTARLAAQLDNGTGGVGPSVNFTLNSNKHIVLSAVVNRTASTFTAYTHAGVSGSSDIASYGSILINTDMYFGRASFNEQQSLIAQGFRMYGFFVIRQALSQVQLDSIGSDALPEAYT